MILSLNQDAWANGSYLITDGSHRSSSCLLDRKPHCETGGRQVTLTGDINP